MIVVMCLITQSCPTLCDPMDCSPPGSSVHGHSPGKNTGVGCRFLLQGFFPTRGWNLCLLHCIPSEPPGKPKLLLKSLEINFPLNTSNLLFVGLIYFRLVFLLLLLLKKKNVLFKVTGDRFGFRGQEFSEFRMVTQYKTPPSPAGPGTAFWNQTH